MPSLISSFAFIVWSVAIIGIYYSNFYSSINHIETATGFLPYLATIAIIYSGYKILSIAFGVKKIRLGLPGIIGIGLFHVFLVTIFYTGLPEVTSSPFLSRASASSITLFFHILALLFYPAIVIVLTRSAGYTLFSLVKKDWKEVDKRLRIPGEITLGFTIFSFFLLILGMIGVYNEMGLYIILGILGLIALPGLKLTYNEIKDTHIEIENHKTHGTFLEKLNPNLLSIEFGFIIFTLLLGVSLINVIRPMPIGWDDLGVYMNLPKIIATTEQLITSGGMYAWQLITGTGFLFSYNASQAFYMNQLGGILATIFVISILSYAFEDSGKKTIISLPVLLGVFYYAMPMTVFQQAKDMKLDPAYFAFSISTIALLFYVWKGLERKEKIGIIGVIGILVGFTFTVKFTSLMLILGILGWLTYTSLSLWGFIGYFLIFLGVFTKLNLWKMLNVPMPESQAVLNSIGIPLFIIGCASIAFATLKLKNSASHYKKIFLDWILYSVIFLIGTVITCIPWLIKNGNEVIRAKIEHPTISNFLAGAVEKSMYDYKKIYTPEEIKERENRASKLMTGDGKSENEDAGRYFGYEKGLNNYLKLPANLTFQKNQSGEFTDITYLFLALIPSLVLFIPSKRKYSFVIGGISAMVFMALYYFTKGIGGEINGFFAQFTLIPNPSDIRSFGYLILIAINLGIVWFFHSYTKDNHIGERLRDIVIFMGIYAFLFIISAFGIVWYGIIIYFGFFLILGFSAYSFTHYSEDELKDSENLGHKFTLSIVLFILIATYFIRSSFPHAWNNLKSAYYNEYKYNTLSQEESIFIYRSDYLLPIATLNLKNPNLAYKGVTENLKSTEMKKFFESNNINDIPIESLHTFLTKYRSTTNPLLKKDIENIGQSVYKNVLYPTKDNENTKGIYRIGTFMTYLINKNTTRYFDDSLLMAFRDFFYDPSPEATIEKMKKMDLGYLLVDLNAATIDKDPRHNLTDRFEKLLLTMNARNLKLVATDNYCIDLAIQERRKGKITTDEAFIDIAGTNYESYRGNTVVTRGQKLAQCQLYIIKLINEGRSKEYPLIDQIATELYAQNATEDMKKIQQIMSKYIGQSWFALFEILDSPIDIVPQVGSGNTNTGASNIAKPLQK
ncbi:MAG: hypothetical protein HHAS10_03130 [Candidatus Altimarinota bacterium]